MSEMYAEAIQVALWSFCIFMWMKIVIELIRVFIINRYNNRAWRSLGRINSSMTIKDMLYYQAKLRHIETCSKEIFSDRTLWNLKKWTYNDFYGYD